MNETEVSANCIERVLSSGGLRHAIIDQPDQLGDARRGNQEALSPRLLSEVRVLAPSDAPARVSGGRFHNFGHGDESNFCLTARMAVGANSIVPILAAYANSLSDIGSGRRVGIQYRIFSIGVRSS